MRRHTIGWFVFTIVVYTHASELRAGVSETTSSNLSLSVTDHVVFASRKDGYDSQAPSSNTLMHEDFVSAQYRDYAGQIQFTNRFGLGDNRGKEYPIVLEKKTVSAEWARWTVVLGDSHQELGKGIALALYRDDLFGVSNTLEGVAGAYHSDGYRAELFGGRVNPLVAPVAVNAFESPLKDHNVWLAGGSIRVPTQRENYLGTHYFFALNQDRASSRIDRRLHTIGASWENHDFIGGLDAYVESNMLFSQSISPRSVQNLPNGYGSYALLVYSPVPWKFKWEVKDYRFYQFSFRRPPTLEEDVVETLNTDNVSASRWVVEHRWIESSTLAHVSYLLGHDATVNSVLHHAVLGATWRGPWRFQLEGRAGFRTMPGRNRMLHGTFKSKLPAFSRGQSIEFGARKQYSDLSLNFIPTVEDKNIFDFTYNFSDKLSALAGYEYVPSNDSRAGKHFFNAGVLWKSGTLTSRGFVGQTSGGTLCSGGICRQVPPFSGAQVETTYSF